MKDYTNYSLLPYNTFGMDVKAARFVEYESVNELLCFLKEWKAQKTPLLHVGRGSNLLFVSDYQGTVLHSGIKGMQVVSETDEWVEIRVGAGEVWDDFVDYTVKQGWYGAENLSLIPGEVGASAVQNIGAYGVEAKDLIVSVETVAVNDGITRIFKQDECGYAYRESVFKRELKGLYIVTYVTYRLKKQPEFHLDYGNIRSELEPLCCGSIFGQEKNVVNAAIAKMNLFLHGASDFNVMQGDTLRDPKILQGGNIAKFDCVIANPPFSLENWGATEWSTDKYKRNIYGTPSDSCGDYAWIQHMICSMSSGKGRMAVVMPQGILFRGNQEAEIRKQLVESDLIEAVVTLGDKLFYGTGLSPCFLIIRRMKPAHHSGRILMIDGSKILTQKRAQNILAENDIDRLYSLYQNYSDEEDYSRIVTLQEIRDKEYNLSPNRYVVYRKEEIRPYAVSVG